METNTSLSLAKGRTAPGCIRDGYQLYMANFFKIFRKSWIAAIVYAIAFSLMTSFFINEYPRMLVIQALGAEAVTAYQDMIVTTLAIMGTAFLFYAISSLFLTSYSLSSLLEHQATETIEKPTRWYGMFSGKALLKCLVLTGWECLLGIIVALLLSGIAYVSLHFLGTLAAKIAYWSLSAIIMLLLMPLAYTFCKYLFTPKAKMIPLIPRTYGTGLRHYGSIFMVLLIVTFTTSILVAIAEMPATILTAANLQSQLGTIMGDPQGMPEYMSWMNIAVFAIAGFILAYIQLSCLFPLYYMYHKIEKDEKDRQEIKQQQ